MKDIFRELSALKEGFLDAKLNNIARLSLLIYKLIVLLIALLIILASLLFFKLSFTTLVTSITIILIFKKVLTMQQMINILVTKVCYILVKLFGRYGRVVTKNDWHNIREYAPQFYRDSISKASEGYCYDFSWIIARFIPDAKIMYCSAKKSDNSLTAHAVIVKNNCVYDTNLRRHYDFDEYIELCSITKIYKFFSFEEYCSDTFLDDIKEDFVKWCAENDTYCCL